LGNAWGTDHGSRRAAFKAPLPLPLGSTTTRPTLSALALLSRKFKDMKNLSEEDLAETAFVRVQPKVVSMLDYRRGVWMDQISPGLEAAKEVG
jgi:hypothetical protein